jgi:acetoacetyl-CoA reductase
MIAKSDLGQDFGEIAARAQRAHPTSAHRLDRGLTEPLTHLHSLFNMTNPVIEGMRERGFGRIVSISSINDQKGQIGQTNYAASKPGDIGFTKSLAQENAGKGITVNAVCPVYIATNRVKAVPNEVLKISDLPPIPMGQLREPEEIARCTLIRDARGVLYV